MLTVALDLDIRDDRVIPAELDLIEAHFPELIKQLIAEAPQKKE